MTTTATKPSSAITLISDADCNALEEAAASGALAYAQAEGHFQRAFVMAQAMNQLQDLITPKMMKAIMPLQGSRLGFATDKQYPESVVKNCLIEAVLRGVQVVGNEFNIIAGNMYITKEGFRHKVREIEGMTDLVTNLGIPRVSGDKGAVVEASATWKMNGVSQSLKREFAIRVNAYMGVDAILGKATRKLLAAVWEQATGSEISMPDGEVGEDMIDVPATSVSTTPGQRVADRVKARKAATEPTPEPDRSTAGAAGDAALFADGPEVQSAAPASHQQALKLFRNALDQLSEKDRKTFFAENNIDPIQIGNYTAEVLQKLRLRLEEWMG